MLQLTDDINNSGGNHYIGHHFDVHLRVTCQDRLADTGVRIEIKTMSDMFNRAGYCKHQRIEVRLQ